MIELIDVTKAFGDYVIYENLNITINDGEFVIFSGPSGSGKTTLLNIIGGLENIDSGQVLVDGKDITKRKNKFNYFQTKVGFLFQNFALVDNKTVEENLDMVYDKARSEMSYEEALDMVGLSNKLSTKVYKLSGGEQQRVALARLLIKKCDIILADEPTGSLDEKNADMVMNMLQEINKLGKTVIMVTHAQKYKQMAGRIIDISEVSRSDRHELKSNKND